MKNITLYAYFDLSCPMVEWEVAIGRVCSICDPIRDKFGISLWHYNNLKNKVNTGKTQEFINELKLEYVRSKDYKKSVSRMRGVYFFESREMAEAALTHWGMRYNPKYISQVNFSANAYTSVDSEWITQNLSSDSNEIDWIHSYWQGKHYWDNPVTEIIASGIGIIVDKKLREEAYINVLNKYPFASKILSYSAAAFFYGVEDAGIAVPALVLRNNRLEGNYYLNMRFFQDRKAPDMERILDYCDNNGAIFPYKKECDESDLLSMPDFNESFIFDNKQVIRQFTQVHGI